MTNHLHFIPITSPLRLESFNLTDVLIEQLAKDGNQLQQGDIVIISSKFAAIAEGRIVQLAEVVPSPAAYDLAEEYKLTPTLAELIIQESDHIFGGIEGFILSVKDNIIAPNAGIDSSNVPAESVVLYPARPFFTAQMVKSSVQQQLGIEIGVILSDSRLMPGRTGTTGVAIGVAGFVPVIDERGKPDLLGKPLKVSQRAVADNLCAAAELLMGEAAEGIPAVVARNTGIVMTGDVPYTWRDLAIDYNIDIYVAIMGKRQ